ncbi:g9641 [Coccomyxa elongata]
MKEDVVPVAQLPSAKEPLSDIDDSAPWSYEPLRPEQLRWYWNKQPYSLKAVYQTDVQHRAHLQRFGDADNVALEKAYRERLDQLERAWWEEEAELSTGPAEQGQGGTISDISPEEEAGPSDWQAFVAGEGKGEAVGQLVRGGLYEVDLVRRRMRCVYWPEHAHRIHRGTWFMEKGTDWVPLKETAADELEEGYRGEIWNPARGYVRPQKQGIDAARLELRSLVNETKGMYALFVNSREMYLCIDNYSAWILRSWSSKPAIGMRLRRGYEAPTPGAVEVDAKAEEADNFAARVPVNRLVFVVHGIGQNLSGSNIGEDASNVRNNLRALAVAELDEKEREAGRTEVLPVQWRKHLNLDIDVLAEALMPPGVRSLRSMLHATAVEVLLYLTPLHCHDMLQSLVTALNSQFAKFMLRHPDFQGSVSIMAHSLGSVLSYDVLCNQPHLYAGLHLPQPPAHSPEAVQQSKRARLGSADTQGKEMIDLTVGSSPPSALGSSDNRGPLSHSIDADLTDLTCMLTPTSQARSPTDSSREEERRLWAENARLRRELALAQANLERAAMGAAAGPSNQPIPATGSSPTGSTGGGSDWYATAAAAQEHASLAPAVQIPELDFSVDQFFCIGSPLGLFLALRKVDPGKGHGLGTRAAATLMPGAATTQGQGDGLPAVRRLYNLYHPFDPVGYRLEPLVMAGAEKRRPVFAAYAKGGRRLHVGLQEFGEDVSAAMSAGAAKASSALFSGISSLKLGASFVANAVTIKRVDPRETEGLKEEDTPEEDAADTEALASTSHGLKDTAIWRVTDGPGAPPELAGRTPVANRTAAGRLDFVLQTGPTENPWLSAISSHFTYWTSSDTALFVLRALHGLDVRQGIPKDMAASAISPLGSPTAAAHKA